MLKLKTAARCFAEPTLVQKSACIAGLAQRQGFAAEPVPDKRGEPQQESEEPPGAFATVGLMGIGAVGAVGVAALGVVAVFQIANYVAAGTGRSMMADREGIRDKSEDIRPSPKPEAL